MALNQLEHQRLRSALAKRYTIQRELGRGGMATVYLAQDLKHNRRVAVKVLHLELAAVLGTERFLREITLTANLNHPHILPLLDSGEAGGFLYYAMPFAEGESLRQRLNREHQLPLEDALQIAREVGDALDYAHRQGIVHRDIKPENILIQERHAIVADFGIARAVSVAGGDRITATGVAVGTPAYMSPEQAGGRAAIDARTDVYALGCVLYEVLAGHPPFTGASAQEILARHALDPVPPLRTARATIPPALERALQRALAKTPADRFDSASKFAHALSRTDNPSLRSTYARRAAAGATAVVLLAAATWGVISRTDAGSSRRIDRLAVLPVINLTGNTDQQYLVDGMHEGLIAELAKIGALTVISRQSVVRYIGTDKSVPQIARELGVDGVVEASVARAGDSVRITVQLLEARPAERDIWASAFQRPLSQVPMVEAEIAREISERIRVPVTSQEHTRLIEARTVNPAAFDAWLRGRADYDRRTDSSTARCIAQAERAARFDSTYAPAYSLAATCYLIRTFLAQAPPQDFAPHVKDAARQALALDSSESDAHASLGLALAFYDWDWAAAERELKRGIELTPGSSMANAQYGWFLAWLGRNDEALAYERRAEELDPRAPLPSYQIAIILLVARRYDEAVTQAQRAVALFPEAGFAYDRLGFAYEAKGMYREAIKAHETALRLMGDIRRTAFLGGAYARAGRTADARKILDRLLRLSKTQYVPPTAVAAIYVGLGQTDNAIRWLEKGYEGRDADMVLLRAWPIWDPLRVDPRFQSILQRMNFPEARQHQ